MRRVTAVAVLSLSLTTLTVRLEAQDARQRQAAAEAYDKGTTAYVDQAYGEAAVWFETANRLAPAAPALMQAIRSHEKNGNSARATTLALELQSTYREDATTSEFAQGVLDKNSPSLLRVQVACDEDCKLDLDGKLQEYLTFFVSPDERHKLTATFETGSKSSSFQGAAGETKDLTFAAPPAPPVKPISFAQETPSEGANESGRKPLPPLGTWIGLGVTVALGAATAISGVDALNGVKPYEDAAKVWNECTATMMQPGECAAQEANAKELLDKGRSRELRTNILIGATAVAAVGTGVIAFLLTDWSGSGEKAQNARSGERAYTRLHIAPLPGGVSTVFEGRF
jgi:hypothetical protein